LKGERGNEFLIFSSSEVTVLRAVFSSEELRIILKFLLGILSKNLSKLVEAET
jgi:hypothetical protein